MNLQIRHRGPSSLAVFLLAIVSFTPDVIVAQTRSVSDSEMCDSGLLGNRDSAIAYQPRGDRCEGVYRLQVNSTHLHLSSLTESFESIDVSSPEALKLGWTAPLELASERLRLRVEGLRPHPESLYRMDALASIEEVPFAWSGAILETLDLSRDDLGALGWFRLSGGNAGDGNDVYLPVRLYQKNEPGRTGVYEVGITPKKRLREVYVTVTPVDISGTPRRSPITNGEALEFGYYPADQPTFFEVSSFQKKGYYKVDVRASFEAGGSGTLSFVLYHETGNDEGERP